MSSLQSEKWSMQTTNDNSRNDDRQDNSLKRHRTSSNKEIIKQEKKTKRTKADIKFETCVRTNVVTKKKVDVNEGSNAVGNINIDVITHDASKTTTNRRERQWYQKLSELKEYHKENGHCRVRSKNNDRSLYHWAMRQKEYLNLLHIGDGKGCPLKPQWIKELKDIGFDWDNDIHEDDHFEAAMNLSQEKFEALDLVFKSINELEAICNNVSTDTPQNTKKGKKEGRMPQKDMNWKDLIKQYMIKYDSNATYEKETKFKIPSKMSPSERNWHQKLNEIIKYKIENNGSTNVSCSVNRKLYQWVEKQKEIYKLANQAMNNDFEKGTKASSRNVGIAKDDDMQLQGNENTIEPPPQPPPTIKSKTFPLTSARDLMAFVKRLHDQAPNATFRIYLQEVKAYKELNNNCDVPLNYPANKALGHWVAFMTQEYANYRESKRRVRGLSDDTSHLPESILTMKEIRELDRVDFISAKQALEDFKEEQKYSKEFNKRSEWFKKDLHGNYKGMNRELALDNIIGTRINAARGPTMISQNEEVTEEKIYPCNPKTLDRRDKYWYSKFHQLKQYKKQFKTYNVSHKQDRILYNWLLRQQQMLADIHLGKKTPLKPSWIQSLESIGTPGISSGDLNSRNYLRYHYSEEEGNSIKNGINKDKVDTSATRMDVVNDEARAAYAMNDVACNATLNGNTNGEEGHENNEEWIRPYKHLQTHKGIYGPCEDEYEDENEHDSDVYNWTSCQVKELASLKHVMGTNFKDERKDMVGEIGVTNFSDNADTTNAKRIMTDGVAHKENDINTNTLQLSIEKEEHLNDVLLDHEPYGPLVKIDNTGKHEYHQKEEKRNNKKTSKLVGNNKKVFISIQKNSEFDVIPKDEFISSFGDEDDGEDDDKPEANEYHNPGEPNSTELAQLLLDASEKLSAKSNSDEESLSSEERE